jgi:hypothetical protein
MGGSVRSLVSVLGVLRLVAQCVVGDVCIPVHIRGTKDRTE